MHTGFGGRFCSPDRLLRVFCHLYVISILTSKFSVILVPIAFVVVSCPMYSWPAYSCDLQAAKYGITNEASIGALCTPLGVGNLSM